MRCPSTPTYRIRPESQMKIAPKIFSDAALEYMGIAPGEKLTGSRH